MIHPLSRVSSVLCCALYASILSWAQQGPAIAWQQTFGDDFTEQAEGIWCMADGAVVVAGSVFATEGVGKGTVGDWDARVWKVDAQGALVWERTFGGSATDKAMAVIGSPAGGFRVVGHTDSADGDVEGAIGGSDVWLLELDAEGALLGQRCYGGSSTDEAWDMAATADGGCVIVGHSNSMDGQVGPTAGGSDYWVLRLNATGDIVWQRSVGGSLADEAWAVDVAPDGGFYVAGSTSSVDGDFGGSAGEEDYGIVRLSADGALVWQRTLGGSWRDQATAIRSRTAGGCVVGGITFSSDGDVTEQGGQGDGWLVALDDAGEVQWQRSYGGTHANAIIDLVPAPGGGYVGVGTDTNSPQLDLWALRVDDTGALLWEAVYGGSADDQGRCVLNTPEGGYLLGGHSYSNDGDVGSNNGLQDMWLVELGVDVVGMPEDRTDLAALRVAVEGRRVIVSCTNPVKGQVLLYDARDTLQRSFAMTGTEKTVDLDGLAAGTYMLGLHADAMQRTVPLILR